MFWGFRHSVVANANRQTVWEFASNIDNLARIEGDAVESMTLDGPFPNRHEGDDKDAGPGAHALTIGEGRPARTGHLRNGVDRGGGLMSVWRTC
jgi:hypothetical protein